MGKLKRNLYTRTVILVDVYTCREVLAQAEKKLGYSPVQSSWVANG